jgi:hypothetical protein
MKRLLTIGVLAVLAIIVAARRQVDESRPQDAIYAMFDAERAGNVDGYLGAYTGALEQSLRGVGTEMGEDAFRRSLQQRAASVKGIAVAEPEQVSDNEMKARVELVYADRNEVQIFKLVKIASAWKVAAIEGAQPVKAPVPYGTVVQ